MKFAQILKRLRDGREYKFTHPGIAPWHFHKAPYPEQFKHTRKDGAVSAITYRNGRGQHTVIAMLLDDFDRDDWVLEEVK